ncbi:MAG: DUF4347 domain-containing protein [Bacteroidia bacterium]|nr:DUF4347 domain-containing protein [Bacteroidia bacterium]
MILFYKILKLSVLSLILIIHPALDLTGQPVSLIVIDPLVEKESRNIANLPGQKVVILPDEGNPLKFITKELKESTYDEIHLFLLTKQGSIIFDEINIIPENIQDYAGDFGEWKSITKPEFKIVIHSEDLASGQEGLFLVKKITEFTGREVIVKK